MLGALSGLIASNIAISLTQRKADYSLNYAYGAKGVEQLKKFLKEKAPLEVFTTTEGVIANIEGIRFSGIGVRPWNTPKLFLDFMNENKPQALVYGLPTNNIAQLKRIFYSPEVKAFFDKYYREYVFGSYIMQIRDSN